TAGDQELAVGAEGDAAEGVAVLAGEDRLVQSPGGCSCSVQLPDADRPRQRPAHLVETAAAGGQEPAVRAVGDAGHPARQAPQYPCLLALLQVPEAARLVLHAAGELLAVRAEGHGVDQAAEPFQGETFRVGLRVPELDAAVAAGAEQLLAVGGKGQAGD